MTSPTLVFLVVLIAGVSSITVNSNTDLSVYVSAMIRAGDVCETVVGNNAYTVTAKNCRLSCNYPSGVCVTEYRSNDIFADPSYRCIQVSSACQSAVGAQVAGSVGGGGSATTSRPSATAATTRAITGTTQRTAAPTTRAPVTAAPSIGGASCTGARDSGTRSSTVRFSSKYYYDTSKKACLSFLYWGTGGNANRHESKAACEKACLGSAPAPSAGNKANCDLPPREGAVTRSAAQTCAGSGRRYSALSSSRGVFCVSFTFSNCPNAGNANNFKTKAECEALCKA